MATINIDLSNSPLKGLDPTVSPYEPRRRNLFVWYIEDKESNNNAMFYARATSIPEVSIPFVEDHYITARWYVHGAKWEFGEINVEFMFSYPEGKPEDKFGKDMYTLFWNWLKRTVSWMSPFSAALSGQYESTGYLVLLKPDLTVSKIYQLVRCWPRVVGAIDLNYETGDILRLTVTFRYDRMFMMDRP